MKKEWFGVFLYLAMILMLAGLGFLTWSSLFFIFGKDIPWYLFAWVFIGYLGLLQKGSK